MNKNKYQYLEEIAKIKGKKLLVEETNSVISLQDTSIEVFDKTKLVENGNGQKWEARAVLKNVPISKFTENFNGRIYPKSLFERLVAKGEGEGTSALINHPDDDSDGDLTNLCGAWHSMRVNENNVTADLYLIGENGQLILEGLKSGLKIGTSSVGFGEISESDGKTVDPNSYELQRCADLVMVPSQGTFATIEHLNETQVEKISEELKQELKEQIIDKKNDENVILSKSENTNIIEEQVKSSDANIDKNNIKDNEVKENMEEKRIHEANLKNHIIARIKESKKNDNISEAIEDLKGIDIPETMVDLQEKVNSAVGELQVKMEQQKSQAELTLKETETKYKALSEKYAVACKTLDEMKARYLKAKSLLEQIEKKDKNAVAIQLKEMDVMKENIKNMTSDLDQLSSDRKNMIADIKQFITERKRMIGRINGLVEKFNKAKKIVKKMKEEELETSGDETVKVPETDDVENKPYEFDFTEEDEITEPEIDDETVEEAVDGESDEDTGLGVDTDTGDLQMEADADLDSVISDEEPVEEAEGDDVVPFEDEEPVVESEDFDADDIPVEDEKPVEEAEGDVDVDITDEDDEDLPSIEDEPKEIDEDGMMGDEEGMSQGEYKFGQKGQAGGVMEKKKVGKPAPKLQEKVIKKEDVIKDEIKKFLISEIKKTPSLKDVAGSIMKSTSLTEAVEKISKFKASKKKSNDVVKVNLTEGTATRPSWMPAGRI